MEQGYGVMKRTQIVTLVACCWVLAAAGPSRAQDNTERELEKYRQMMKEDPWSNPALLDADRGEDLWKNPRGPKNVSLEGCDLGKGPGKVDGAFAELPRYFADAGKVMDVEARILWCMEKLQGFDRAKLIERPHPGGGAPVKEIGAIATYVASRSHGLKFAAKIAHPMEKETLALGENLFFRRMGPMDFACATCHGDSGKRIRLQPLPYLSKPAEARAVVGEWPAYRVSTTHVMTMQHRIYDCFWQMRLPEVEFGSDVTVALVAYLVNTANGGDINAPGMKR
jgi:L-cysteine S-thiosulfotransferase